MGGQLTGKQCCLLTVKRPDLVRTAKYGLELVPDLDTEPEPEPKFFPKTETEPQKSCFDHTV